MNKTVDKKTERINFVVSPKLKNDVYELAKNIGLSPAAYIRMVLIAQVEKEKNK